MLFLRILPPRVVIHTDGSCNETLTGGYAAIVRTGVDEFIDQCRVEYNFSE